MNFTQENIPPNRIAQFFGEKTIFITGGSGFVGQVLIEKLLRSCTTLKKIYVLIRAKKNKTASERLEQILNGPLFDSAKAQHGSDVIKKVEAISGDVIAPDLGIKKKDRAKLIEETEIIYHCAATVKFDDPLKFTILLNVRGTKLMLDLAKECKRLVFFSHLSTAYCHEDQEVVYEKLYPPPADPYAMINLCENLDEDILEGLAKKLRGKNANNYSFSKALGEALVGEELNNLPIIIQRPSAIIPIWKEPIPGWTNNINGPIGLFIGVGRGAIRTVYVRDNRFIDCIPVDIVANALIATAFYYTQFSKNQIYNLVAAEETEKQGITPRNLLHIGMDIINNDVAFNAVLWYPNVTIKRYKIHHYFDFFFFQLMPAIFIDAILLLVGVKPFLFGIQKRIWNGYNLLEYYANRKWNFDNQKGKRDRELMNSTEKKVFKLDPSGAIISEYLLQCTLSCRRYMMKEKDEDIPVALRRMKMLRYLDTFCKMLFAVGLFYFLIKLMIH